MFRLFFLVRGEFLIVIGDDDDELSTIVADDGASPVLRAAVVKKPR